MRRSVSCITLVATTTHLTRLIAGFHSRTVAADRTIAATAAATTILRRRTISTLRLSRAERQSRCRSAKLRVFADDRDRSAVRPHSACSALPTDDHDVENGAMKRAGSCLDGGSLRLRL